MAPASICGVWGSLVTMEMIDLVNPMLPREQQFPLLGGRHRLGELHRRYRALFPDGKLAKRVDVLTITMFSCLAAASLVLIIAGVRQR